MQRPGRFEHNRFVGDKRTLIAHDIDRCDAPSVIDDLMGAGTFLCFGPDSAGEARNRGYKLCRQCPGVRDAAP
jgi:hypothetical protein